MVWNPLSWRYWPSQGCCNNLYGQIYTAFSWSDYFICRKMCSIFGYQLHYVVPNYCQRLGNAPSKRCKLHIRNVNVQIYWPKRKLWYCGRNIWWCPRQKCYLRSMTYVCVVLSPPFPIGLYCSHWRGLFCVLVLRHKILQHMPVAPWISPYFLGVVHWYPRCQSWYDQYCSMLVFMRVSV